MNQEAQDVLNEILKKEPESLSFNDRAFLRARRSYLKKAQLEEYKSVLDENEVAPVEQESFQELLARAKGLGFTGKRVKRSVLQAWLNEHNNNPFIN